MKQPLSMWMKVKCHVRGPCSWKCSLIFRRTITDSHYAIPAISVKPSVLVQLDVQCGLGNGRLEDVPILRKGKSLTDSDQHIDEHCPLGERRDEHLSQLVDSSPRHKWHGCSLFVSISELLSRPPPEPTSEGLLTPYCIATRPLGLVPGFKIVQRPACL
jgi:hypothetical protein